VFAAILQFSFEKTSRVAATGDVFSVSLYSAAMKMSSSTVPSNDQDDFMHASCVLEVINSENAHKY
jgi:hypothetical protein